MAPGNMYNGNTPGMTHIKRLQPRDKRWGFSNRNQETVFNVLADLANDDPDSECQISGPWLANVTGLHAENIKTIMSQLRKLGFVETVKHHASGQTQRNVGLQGPITSRYKVHIPEGYPVGGYPAQDPAPAANAGAALFDMGAPPSPQPNNYH